MLDRAELPVDTTKLARFLIGKMLVRTLAEGVVGGRIVETEAYPIGDPAFHESFAAARVADRYLTVSSATEDGRPPYTVLSVPAPS